MTHDDVSRLTLIEVRALAYHLAAALDEVVGFRDGWLDPDWENCIEIGLLFKPEAEKCPL